MHKMLTSLNSNRLHRPVNRFGEFTEKLFSYTAQVLLLIRLNEKRLLH